MSADSTADYSLGVNNIIYKAKGFATEKNVTCFIWKPNMEKSDEISLIELSHGLYTFSHYFEEVGIHNAIFLEDDVPTRFHAFRIGYKSLRLP